MTQIYSRATQASRLGGRLALLGLLLGSTSAVAQLSGTYYVGTSASPNPARTYSSLPAAMAALGSGTSGNVTLQLLDATYALSAALTVPAPTGGFRIEMVPAAGVSPVISGSVASASGGLLILDGTDNLTISGYDGSTSARTITIQNTGAGPAVLLRNDATGNVLRYLNLESANTGTSSGTVLFGTSTGTTGNDQNVVENCSLRAVNNAATGLPAYALYSMGTAAAANSDNTIRACSIYNFTAGGVYLNAAGTGGNWTVGGPAAADGNSIYEGVSRNGDLRFIRLAGGDAHTVSNNQLYYANGALSAAFYGIAVIGGGGHTLTNNTIGGTTAGAGGGAFTVSGSGFIYPFYLDLGTTAATAVTSIQGNVVSNFASTSSGTMYGIDLRNGQIALGTTAANRFGGTGSGQGITHAGTFYGLHIENAAAATVQNNTFAGISTTVVNSSAPVPASQAGTLAGVYVSSSAASTVSGNTFTGLSGTITNTATGTTASTANATPVAGVYGSGSGAVTVSNNTMSNLSSAATVATGATSGNIPLAGVWLNGTGASAVSGNQITGLSATGGVPVAGILLSGNGAGTVDGNTISNVASNLTTAAFLAGISTTGSGVVVISNNSISNLSQTGLTSNLYGIQNNGVAGSHVTGNTISGITYSGSTATNTGYGIFATGTNTISNNTVTMVRATGSSKMNLRGMYVGGAGAAATVEANVVSGILNSSTGSDVQTIGIFVGPTAGTMGAVTVRGNRISNVGTVNTTATTSTNVLAGLQCGTAASGSVIERNRIWNVYGNTAGTGANADQVRGLVVIGTYSGTFANNQISLAAGAPGQLTYGIQDASTGGSNSYYYNSVYLAAASGTTASSYAFWRSNATPPTVELRNNLLYNGRSGATAFAIGTAGTTNWPATTSNYNLLLSAGAAAVGNWGGSALSFTDWKDAQPAGSGGDASSLSATTATVPAANLFTDPATGNLDLNPAAAESWYANGNGVQLAGQTADFGSAAAGRATAVAGGGTDIGSDEFTPTAAPPALDVSGAPAAGGTQVFGLGGRTIATLTYGSTGTVPAAVAGRYYSGTSPAVAPATTRYTNSFVELTATGGSGYTYDLVLSYDEALLGTVQAEASQRLLRRNSDGTYSFLANTTADAAANTLTATGLTDFGQFFGTDQGAPLPVSLTGFSAFRVGDVTQLDWSTATESNSAGYEVQVADNGRSFRALGFVRSTSANSFVPHYYQFTDTEPGKEGMRYYRLRQLDLDGKFSYSAVQAVSFGPASRLPLLMASPNPFSTALTLTLTSTTAEPAELMITDATGRVVMARQLALPAGATRLAFPQLGALPAGLYVVQVQLHGQVQRLKVIKE